MSPNITIPLATEADASRLLELALEAFLPNFEKYGHYPSGMESLEWHVEQIRGGFCHAIMDGKKLVGGIYLLPHPGNRMKVSYFFIAAACQGKGLGSTVLAFVEEWYADVMDWFLATPYRDYANHRFYEKHGYVKAGEFQPMEDNDFILFIYEKTKAYENCR